MAYARNRATVVAVRGAARIAVALTLAACGPEKRQPAVVVPSIAGEWTNVDSLGGLRMLILQRGASTIISGVFQTGPLPVTRFSGSGSYRADSLSAVLSDRQANLLQLNATAVASDSLQATLVIDGHDTLPMSLHQVSRRVLFPELTKQVSLRADFDKFRNYSSVSTSWMRIGGGLEILAFYSYTGREPTTPEWVTLMLSRTGDDWAFVSKHHLTMLLDDSARLDLGDLDHDGTVGDGYVLEQMSTRVSLYDFLRIVNAVKIEGELSSTQFTVRGDARAALRTLAARIGTQWSDDSSHGIR